MDHQDDTLSAQGDFKELTIDLKSEIEKTNARLDRFHESISTQRSEGFSKILRAVEELLALTQKVDRHQIITSWRVDEIEKRVKTLEAR